MVKYKEVHKLLNQIDYPTLCFYLAQHMPHRPDEVPEATGNLIAALLKGDKNLTRDTRLPEAQLRLLRYYGSRGNLWNPEPFQEPRLTELKIQLYTLGLISSECVPTPMGLAYLDAHPCPHHWTGGSQDGLVTCSYCYEEKDLS